MVMQSLWPALVSPSVIQVCDILFISIECLAVPGFWLWETGRNFPELTSTRNNVLRRCILFQM